MLRCRLSEQHFAAVVGANGGAGESVSAVRKHVERDVIRVRPDTHFRIIGKISVGERIPVPGASRIAGLRNRYALQVRCGADRKLGNDPAVGHAIVNHHRITIVVRLASSAKSTPQGVDRHWAVNQRAALIIYGEICVHGLDVMIRANVAVRIGRRRVHGEAGHSVSDAIEIG